MPGGGLGLGEMVTELKQGSQGLLISDSFLLVCSVPTPSPSQGPCLPITRAATAPGASVPTASQVTLTLFIFVVSLPLFLSSLPSTTEHQLWDHAQPWGCTVRRETRPHPHQV